MIKYFGLCVLVFSSFTFSNPVAIDEFTQDMTVKEGLFNVYYQHETGQIYLEISDFSTPFLFQSSLPQGIGSNDIGLDRGQLGGTRLVQFERFGNKVMLKQLNTQYRVSSNNTAERASIDEAFADSVIAGLSVVATQGNVVLVDYTDFLLSDIHGIAVRLEDTKQGKYAIDKNRSGVYLPRSKSFPDNTELEALVTFAGSKPGQFLKQVAPSATSISVNLHHSLIRLPDDNYQPRVFHPYSGYWKVSYQDYSVAIDQPMEQKFIPRHRLHKKQPNAAVSEAVEPIIYYLDPGIPEPIKSALRDGANWWDQAFERIGYKDAFQIKTLPADADPMDIRYNVIQWVHRATRGWSYGSSVIDPRTGEILKGHVTLGSLRVRQDYLIALGLTSPFESENTSTKAQQQMALARIRQLSAHEVGHTLGIAHNFAASADGRESVMDYPHPKVSIVDGKVSLADAYAVGMGAWDNYVIAYGYQDLAEDQNERVYLSNLVAQAHQNNLAYQSDPDARPRHAANAKGHLWDNGGDPVEDLANLLEVRQVALSNFGINSIPQGNSLASLQEVLVPIYYLHRYQMDAVAKLIGGVNYQYETKGDFATPQGISYVDHQQQNKALTAMLDTLSSQFLRIPDNISSLITPKVYGEQNSRESFQGRNGLVFDPVSAAEASAGQTLALLLQTQRLNRIVSRPIKHKDQLTVPSMLDAIFAVTVKQAKGKFAAQVKQRVDYVVLNSVMQAMLAPDLAPEARGLMLVRVTNLHNWLNKNKRYEHYRAMATQLDWFIQTGEWKGGFEVKPLPPGSPI